MVGTEEVRKRGEGSTSATRCPRGGGPREVSPLGVASWVVLSCHALAGAELQGPRTQPAPRPAQVQPHSLVIFHVINDIVFRRRAGAAGLVRGRGLPRHPDHLGLEPRPHVRVPSVNILVGLPGTRKHSSSQRSPTCRTNNADERLLEFPGGRMLQDRDSNPNDYNRIS